MKDAGRMWEKWREIVMKELTGKGYRKIVVTGQGGFSVVLRVWDDRSRCFWACKVSRISRMAENEAEMLRGIKHPLFPKYETSWEGQGCFFLVMEYIFGSNIRELCQKRKQFTERQAVRIGLELAKGILVLHEREIPILFRDIKPENVMIRQDGSVKLVDMGCAVPLDTKQCMAGSKVYSAPEQFRRSQKAGVECDVYALGMLIWFMLTGMDGAGGLRENMEAGGKRVSRGLRRLVEQATRQECQNRIPDMRMMIKHLEIYEKKYSLKRVWEGIKSIILRVEIVDFYYMQNIRRGIDNQHKM